MEYNYYNIYVIKIEITSLTVSNAAAYYFIMCILFFNKGNQKNLNKNHRKFSLNKVKNILDIVYTGLKILYYIKSNFF